MTDRPKKPAPQTPRRKDQEKEKPRAEIERLYRRIRRERKRGEGIFADPWPPF
jgi:hypothetical protein